METPTSSTRTRRFKKGIDHFQSAKIMGMYAADQSLSDNGILNGRDFVQLLRFASHGLKLKKSAMSRY
jgi:hypothetical protein